jgi:hypothetical protein
MVDESLGGKTGTRAQTGSGSRLGPTFSGISRRLFLANGLTAAGSLFIGRFPAFANSSKSTPIKNIDFSGLKGKFKGQIVTAGDANFKNLVVNGLWNKLQPDRAPEVIARVANEQDVVEAVRFAKVNKLKVVVRGGGHNWCCPSLRNGGMMIDLTELNQVISIDATARKAVVQPIISNRDLQKRLNAENLSYPTGHCPPVKISGYLLSGGMAWNQGVWGSGIGSVEAIELVTPDGELIRADKDNNTDYYWAARGAGPGFFGVVVRYHLKLYPLPKYITASSYSYSMDDLQVVAEWLGQTAGKLPNNVELSLFLVQAPPDLVDKCQDHGGKICLVTASVFAESEAEAKEATKLLDECPAIAKCLSKTQNQHVNFEKLFDMSGALWPGDLRCHVEAMFSDSNPKDLFAAVSGHFEKTPSFQTVFMFAFFTGPNVPAPLPDAAFSMSAHLYGGPWTMWENAEDDRANDQWHKKCLELIKPFLAGHYISESDTVTYPDHVKTSYSARNYKRIEELRKKYDPSGVFFNYFDGLS